MGEQGGANGAMGGNPLLKSFLSGGFGGMCLVFVGQPFDLVKVRLQTWGPGAKRPSATSLASTILRAEGVRGLYRGMAAPLAGVTPIFALCFWAYEGAKSLLADARGVPVRDLPLSHVALAGALSAIPTTLIMAPGERIKVLLQVQQGRAGAGAPALKGPTEVVKVMHKTGGVRSLFLGSAATLARDGTGSMAYFSVYEGLKRWSTYPAVSAGVGPMDGTLSPPPLPSDAGRASPVSPGVVLLAGGFAGVANWLVALPIDTIKSRIQAQAPGSAKPHRMLHVGSDIVRSVGWGGLYRGIGPALLRAFPANAACFGGIEASKAVLDRYM